MMTAVLRGTLEALRRFDWIGGVTFTVTGLAYLVPIPLVLKGAGLLAVVSVALLARLIGLAAMGWLVFRCLPVRQNWETASNSNSGAGGEHDVKEVFRFAGWSTLSALAAPVLLYLDRILLALFVSVMALAYYAPAFEAAIRLLLIPMSVASVLFPAISASKSIRETTSQSAHALALILSALVGPVILVVGLAPDLLSWWLGPAARAAAPALRVLGAGILMNALAYVPFALLQGRGRADVPALVHLAELPVHVLVSVILVQRFGVLGAALAWTIRVSLDCCALWLLVWRMRLLERAAWPSARVGAAAACALSLVLAAAWASAQPGAYTRWLGTAATLAVATWCMLRWRSRANAAAAFSAADPARS
jgi:O-antigen/teichoic acid export membrane protein